MNQQYYPDPQKIIDGYNWIDIAAYRLQREHSWEENIQKLRIHHHEEMTFLISFARRYVGPQVTYMTNGELPHLDSASEEDYYYLDTLHAQSVHQLIEEIRSFYKAILQGTYKL